jgi:aminoglycoside phosphotransferase (APT) family kinase protein
MDTERICPSCQKPLAPDVPLGLCPECLIKSGFPSGMESAGAKQPPFIPPTVEELATLFPQLEILELIGKGGMGAVYKARQPRLNRFVALKILPPSIGSDPAFAERFAREAQALAQLNHPGIVTLYEFGQAGGLHFFMMEYVDGVNLRQLLINGRIAPREALAIVPQICDALQFAHDQGIVHRDIKPENILLDRRGRVKVADFGLAKIIGGAIEPVPGASRTGASLLTETGKILGTPQYMSPEQIAHPADVDHRADIYALGVVFYQMLTGELPGKKIEPPSKKVHIDVRLDEVVLRALEKKPELRYQQASQLKTEVETIAHTEGPKIESRGSRIEPRFCGAAIAGACLIPLFFASVFFWDFGHLGGLQALVGVVLSTLGFVAILGTTILGWVAVSQIRRSKGRLYGMWLALTDGLLVPVLLLDVLTVLSLLLTNKVLNHWLLAKWYPALKDHAFLNVPHSLVWLLFATAAVLAVDYALIRRVWGAMNQPVATAASTVQKPDRFWRWFAVTVVALIASPFVNGALLMILTPLFIIFFEARERAQAVNRQNEQPATAMPEQQVLAEFDGARLATTNVYIGQSYFPKGDSIVITSVYRTKEQMVVKGHYNLVSTDRARLALYITTSSTNSTHPDSRQWVQISKGQGDFELTHPHVVPGLPHLNMYPVGGGGPFAELYFGTQAEAAEEGRLGLGH